MSLEIQVGEEAEYELRTAYLWYESIQPGLGEELLDCVDSVFDILSEHPRRFRVIHEDARLALVRRFPYQVIYLVGEARVLVVAIPHAKQDSSGWTGRLG